MVALVERINSSGKLPSSVVARYQMQWERNIVGSGGKSGASEEIYHALLFFSPVATAPPTTQMMDRKLATKG